MDALGTADRLVAAATELLAEGGVEAVTLRAVGDRAGVSRSAPYRHFRDKDHLLATLALAGFTALNAEIAASVEASDGTPMEVLRQGCAAYVRFGLAAPAYYRLMFSGEVDKKANPELEATVHQALDTLNGALEACVRTGQIRPLFQQDLGALIWAEMHGLVELTLSGALTHKLGDDRAAHRLVAAFITGLAP